MHSPSVFIIATFMSIAIASPVWAEDCAKKIPGLDAYDRELKQAIQDEPEDLPKKLGRYSKALDSRDQAKADRIGHKIRTGSERLKGIDPPVHLESLHADLIDYYGAGVAVLSARDGGDASARRAAELDTWLGLKLFFTNLRDISVRYACNQGDVEALERDYLPRIEEIIEQIRRGEDPPERY